MADFAQMCSIVPKLFTTLQSAELFAEEPWESLPSEMRRAIGRERVINCGTAGGKAGRRGSGIKGGIESHTCSRTCSITMAASMKPGPLMMVRGGRFVRTTRRSSAMFGMSYTYKNSSAYNTVVGAFQFIL